MADHPFSLQLDVRDYECDMEGIVNNAVYLHYLEHARHHLLKHKGLDFAVLVRQGVHLVVVRIELDYLYPLRSGDSFVVESWTERVSRLRFAFRQEIYRLPDRKLILRGNVIGTAINEQGRPVLPKEVEHLLETAGKPNV